MRRITLVFVILLLAVACGSSDVADEPSPEGGDDPVTAGQGEVTLSIVDFAFGAIDPVPAGSTVRVVNGDDATHTWTAADGTFDSGRIDAGGEFATTVDTPGEYAFMCSIHPSMTGTLVVTE
ncbi:cupredoxin domain-containing protein [Euzebya pacifica]|jgi:plastocyanin|uniref:cupredoxin domain-containing protein n=1 Tax=Euzebya pacifica TaxID=1608957 RepID=UPI0030FB1DB6